MTLSTKIEVFCGFYICSQWVFIHAQLSRVPFALAGLSCNDLLRCASFGSYVIIIRVTINVLGAPPLAIKHHVNHCSLPTTYTQTSNVFAFLRTAFYAFCHCSVCNPQYWFNQASSATYSKTTKTSFCSKTCQ